jgi:hypothetical protein
MSNEYRVEWSIDVTATDPEDAAKQALAIQRDPGSTALEFTVHDATGQVSTQNLSGDSSKSSPPNIADANPVEAPSAAEALPSIPQI